MCDSPPHVCELAYETCVVALDRSCGRVGAIKRVVEWDVDGREVSAPSGRGGSGGGVPSHDGSELVDVRRDRACIRPRAELARKSRVSVDDEPWRLFCVGGVGGVGGVVEASSTAGGRDSAGPGASSMKEGRQPWGFGSGTRRRGRRC